MEITKALVETNSVQFLEWNYHIEALEQIRGFESDEKQDAEQALLYLQRVLGDDFLRRCNVDEPFVARHPMLKYIRCTTEGNGAHGRKKFWANSRAWTWT